MKFIENKSDKKICTEIDKLNESVYNLNGLLRLSKDIDEMKRENSVKNDIQRKLSLKSQWLLMKCGSTGNLNDRTATGLDRFRRTIDSENYSDQNVNSSTECLKKRRKKPSKMKSLSIRSLFSTNSRTGSAARSHKSVDELSFDEGTKVNEYASCGNLQTQQQSENDKRTSSHTLAKLKNRIDKIRDSQAKYVEPKASIDPSKRDLSRFFPPKNEATRNKIVSDNQKELKDVDLSKYFLPSPVQELKSIPTPGCSPQLERKATKNANNKHMNFTSKELDTPKPTVQLRLPDKNLHTTPTKRLSDKIDEIAGDLQTGSEYHHLVDNLKSPTDNIDDIFNEVAGNLSDTPDTPQTSITQPAPEIHSKLSNMDLEESILSKLSSNLLEEIGKLEKHLKMDDGLERRKANRQIREYPSENPKKKHSSDKSNVKLGPDSFIHPLTTTIKSPTTSENHLVEPSAANKQEIDKNISVASQKSAPLPSFLDESGKTATEQNLQPDRPNRKKSIDWKDLSVDDIDGNFTHPSTSTPQTAISQIKTETTQHASPITSIEPCDSNEIPFEMQRERRDNLVKSFVQPEVIPPLNHIGEILKIEYDPRKAHISECNNPVPNAPLSHLIASDHMRPYSPCHDPTSSSAQSPLIPLRRRRKDPTEILIQRSQSIHNKKEEFMNEKLYGGNPYLKKPVARSSVEPTNDWKPRNVSLDPLESAVQPEISCEFEHPEPIERSTADIEQMNKQRTNRTTPPTTNLNVFDLFKRPSSSNKNSSNGKDTCIVS